MSATRPTTDMDAIELPDYEVVDLENAAPGILGLRIVFVNVYASRRETGAR